MKKDYPLKALDPLTKLAKSKGAYTWNCLVDYIKNLPYGRNSNRTDFSLVFTEHKGTCSSKHALLKQLADANKIPNVKLVIGLYKMNSLNTPKIGTVLSDNYIAYIPEAHCYLKINDIRLDITTANSDFNKIEKDLIEELEIKPEQVGKFKVDYQKYFIENWIKTTSIKKSFSEIWEIREQCIENLSH